ncbi:MAG: GNAT family N-acetyltransferase [Chlamydiae bacterium]|nr:GNAT family N-acetyltransferase [Chlamydiota bacterium]
MRKKKFEIVFKTKRMFLRKVTPENIENMQQIFSDPITMQYYPKVLNREETKEWIDKILYNYHTHGAGLWACHLKDSKEFVGICGLNFPIVDGNEEVEVGYLFVRKFWNRGLATEAAKDTVEYAKKKLKLKRIISLIRPENIPSKRVAEKNGLIPEKEVMHKGYRHIVYAKEL